MIHVDNNNPDNPCDNSCHADDVASTIGRIREEADDEESGAGSEKFGVSLSSSKGRASGSGGALASLRSRGSLSKGKPTTDQANRRKAMMERLAANKKNREKKEELKNSVKPGAGSKSTPTKTDMVRKSVQGMYYVCVYICVYVYICACL